MAAGEVSSADKKAARGFAGFSALVSAVDTTIATTATPEIAKSGWSAASGVSQPPAVPPKSQPQRALAPVRGLLAGKRGIAAVALATGLILFATIYFIDGSGRSTPISDHSAQSLASVEPQPAATQTNVPTRPNEERPPYGRENVLTAPQIRYCVAEKIRLDASEGAVTRTSDEQVDRFNTFVTDYNSRCGEFRYVKGAVQRAQREVESFRSQIELEGKLRFGDATGAGSALLSPPVTPSSEFSEWRTRTSP